MASAYQDITNSGGGSSGASGNLVGWRDANNSIGSLFGDAGTPTATSGNITTGDRIIGGSKGFQLGIVKILAIGALVAIVVKLWKGGKK